MNNERRSEIAKMLGRNILLLKKQELHQAATELYAENWELRSQVCREAPASSGETIRCVCCENVVDKESCDPDDNNLPVCEVCRGVVGAASEHPPDQTK